MDAFITPQDVANVVLFVIPGYFAIKTYAAVYAKQEKEFSKILLESVVYSLPIVSIYNLGWSTLGLETPLFTSARYVLPLLIVSIIIGWFFSVVRRIKVLKSWLRNLELPEADEDFLRTQFRKLDKNELVSVALKNGDVFSGMPQSGSIMRGDGSRQYSFIIMAWFNKEKALWEESAGTIIVDLSEVLYFQTESQLPRG